MYRGFGVAVVNDKVYMMGGNSYNYSTNEKGKFSIEEVMNDGNEEYTPFGYGAIPPTVSVLSPQNGTVVTDNLALNFSVSRPDVLVTYCLDGGENRVTAIGNITLNQLTRGSHTITVYSRDSFGNEGAPETIYFTAQGFPAITLIVAVLVAVAVGAAGLVVYLKRKKHGSA